MFTYALIYIYTHAIDVDLKNYNNLNILKRLK